MECISTDDTIYETLLGHDNGFLCLNILFISAIERKMTVFNGKSLRYLYFSVLLAANMRFSRNLAFSSYGELFSVYINNLCGRQIV